MPIGINTKMSIGSNPGVYVQQELEPSVKIALTKTARECVGTLAGIKSHLTQQLDYRFRGCEITSLTLDTVTAYLQDELRYCSPAGVNITLENVEIKNQLVTFSLNVVDHYRSAFEHLLESESQEELPPANLTRPNAPWRISK